MDKDFREPDFVLGRMRALEEAIRWLVTRGLQGNPSDHYGPLREHLEQTRPETGGQFRAGFEHALKELTTLGPGER